MNHRLRDRLNDADPILARVAEMIASVPAIASSEARKERVRKAAIATTPRRTWFPVLLRPSVAVSFARAYLQRYPQGRFERAARAAAE